MKNNNNQSKVTFNKKPCPDSFLCFNEKKCGFHHTEQHKSYIKTLKFLNELFPKEQITPKFLLGTVRKLSQDPQDDKYKFIPCNKEVTQAYPDLYFIVQSTQSLSEEHYYEARYEEKPSKTGEFYVNLVNGDNYWGKIGSERDDIEMLFYGKKPIFDDESKFKGPFEEGKLKEKHNGKIVLKSGDNEYGFSSPIYQNRAFHGSTVKFLERGPKTAQVVSVVKCPLANTCIFGILETTPDPKKQIDMKHLFCPLPEKVDWTALEEIFQKTGDKFATSFTESKLTLQAFKQKYGSILQFAKDDPKLIQLCKLIFKDPKSLVDIVTAKNIWSSLDNLVNHQKEIKKLLLQGCYFRPIDRNLPAFKCLPIKEELLKENPEIWRKYISAKYITWPAASEHPWAVIEGAEGMIGDLESDAKVILEKHKVKTDFFTKEVRENEKDLMKKWDAGIEEFASEKSEEKVFTIDGKTTRNRDDGFSIKKVSEDCYEIGIHIADVTRIVKEETEIYEEAERRFHSTYVGEKKFSRPMLPYELQNHLSLDKGQWRYVFSLFILMNNEGIADLESVRLKHMLIRPVKNFTYREVDDMLTEQNKGIYEDDEVKEGLFLMRELAMKLWERRQALGGELDLDEESEDIEENGEAKMIVKEFMILTNQIITDYVKHQVELMENNLVKIRNEEKRLAREDIEKGKDEVKNEDFEKEVQEEVNKEEVTEEGDVKELKKVDVEEEIGKEKEANHHEVEEKVEDSTDNELEISGYQDEADVQRKGSEDEDESRSNSDVSSGLVRSRGVEETAAIGACKFLQRIWRDANTKGRVLNLTDHQTYNQSFDCMMGDTSIKETIKKYLNYLLRINDKKIKLYINKGLENIDGSHQSRKSDSDNNSPTIFATKKSQPESPFLLKEKSPLLEQKSISSSESPTENIKADPFSDLKGLLLFSLKKSKPKKKLIEEESPTSSLKTLVETEQIIDIGLDKLSKVEEDHQQLSAEENKVNDSSPAEALCDALQARELDALKEGEDIFPSESCQVDSDQEESKEIEEEDDEDEKGSGGFNLKQFEKIVKKYYKLKDSQKMKFTSPIRKFYDILVHQLIDEILKIEEDIRSLDGKIQNKLTEQEAENEEELAQKKKKLKSRYQIFQELDSQLKNRIQRIEESQGKIKRYYEENRDIKEGGMDRANRERKIMEECKQIIKDQKCLKTKGLVVGLSKEIRIFLLDHSLECRLSCESFKSFGDGWTAKVKLADKKEVELQLFDDITVEINVKRDFPLDFEVTYTGKKTL